MLFLRDDLFVHVSRRSAKARKRDERNVSESASAFARGFDREYEREGERALFSGLQFVSPPRAGNQSRAKLSMYKMRGGQERSKE